MTTFRRACELYLPRGARRVKLCGLHRCSSESVPRVPLFLALSSPVCKSDPGEAWAPCAPGTNAIASRYASCTGSRRKPCQEWSLPLKEPLAWILTRIGATCIARTSRRDMV